MPDTPHEHEHDHDHQHSAHLVLLAYQSGLIDRPAFDAILDAWHADRSRPITDLLTELGKVSSESLTFLDALARRHAQDLGGTAHALSALAANAGRSTVEELATRVPDITETFVTRTPSVTQTDHAPGHSTATDHNRPGGVRYRAIRFHARGGLGAVFVAQDEELNRKVALKEIQERYADRPADRDRFLVEAEITGRLEHPGIVPVYGLGSYADGRPFYAMRFIHGESLETACRAYHSDTNQDPSTRAVALRGLLRRFLDVCNAVEYAHSRGVLHRDLKPGNIMVGKYGETLVVDWGLARVMGQSSPAPDDDHDAPIDRASLSGSAQTIHGHAIGTPGYMSPEQADGRLDELGPESDVYSLGATLYFVLTGRGPYSGISSLAELYERLRKGDYSPPRSINPEVPRALDAICRKAMAVAAADRYSTPRALADDLEHYLADEPVDASPDTNLDRLMRWARKHRQATVSAGAALLVIATVATAASFLVDSARRNTRLALQATQQANARAEAALAEANKAKAQADENFKKARATVDDFLTAVSESKALQLLPDTQAFRKVLLERARAYYQGFVKDQSSDPSLQFEAGEASFRVARVVAEIGSKDEAVGLCAEAVRHIEQVALANPKVAAHQEKLAFYRSYLGFLQADTGRYEQAETTYAQAIATFETLVRENPKVNDYRYHWANTLGYLAGLQLDTDRKDLAEKNFIQAIAALETISRENPSVTGYRHFLAKNLGSLAYLQVDTGRYDLAEKNYAQAIALTESLARGNRKVPDYRNQLAHNLINLANLQANTNRKDLAETNYTQAIAIYETLAREYPRVNDYRNSWARNLGDLAILQANTNRKDLAEKTYAQAIAAYETLARDNPKVARFREGLATYMGDLANLQGDIGRKDLAETTYTQAIAIFETLARDNPKVARFREGLGAYLSDLAKLQSKNGHKDQAETTYARAIAAYETLARENPRVPGYQARLGRVLSHLGNHYRQTGRSHEAIRSYQKGQSLLSQAILADRKNTTHQGWLFNVYLNLSQLLRSEGRTTEAVRAAQEMAALWSDQPNQLYDISCMVSLCVPLLSGTDSERVAAEAVGHLRQAVASGWNGAEYTAHDPDLAPIRHRKDFQALLQGLQDRTFPADPFTR